MKLIEIKTNKKRSFTKYKENKIVNNVNGKEIVEYVKTGIPEKTEIYEETYYIPIDNIKKMYEFGEQCFINDLQVSRETFNKVKEEIIKYENK